MYFISNVKLLMDSVDQIQEIIFEYNIKELGSKIEDFISKLEPILASTQLASANLIQVVLEHVNAALCNKDYLLLADLLEYELKPVLAELSREN